MGLRARSIAFRRKSPIRELLLANGKLLSFLSLLIKQRGIGKKMCIRDSIQRGEADGNAEKVRF